MKYLITFATFALLLFSLQKVKAQIKRDTIYYLLDTTKVPIKDRMFISESEGSFKGYVLRCKCFPFGYSIFFYYKIGSKKEKEINLKEFSKLKTVSVTQLMDLAIESLAPANKNKYQFIIAEPEGSNIRLTDMMLWIPTKPRNTDTETTIKPIKSNSL